MIIFSSPNLKTMEYQLYKLEIVLIFILNLTMKTEGFLVNFG